MKRCIGVHTGEIMTGKGETVLKSDTNNACMVIVAYDQERKIGSLAHALFYENEQKRKAHSSLVRDANHAIDEMIKEMTLLGADKNGIEIRLVTGENVSHQQGDPIYTKKLNSAMDVIKDKHLRVTDHSAVDVGNKHVVFDIETGELSYN